MSTFTENDLRTTFTNVVSARKFDGLDHGLSHCMKAVDFTSTPATVLLAGRVQRGRDGRSELPGSAHVSERLCMRLAVPRSLQARVVAFCLVDGFAVEPGKP